MHAGDFLTDVFPPTLPLMSRKRARSSSSSSSEPTEPTLVLSGGEPCPAALVELWRDEILCDVRVQADGGAPFACHRIVLAAGSTMLRGLLTSTRHDAAAPALPEVSDVVLKEVITYIYLGRCEPERRMLPELLRAANFLGVDALKEAAVGALQSLLAPENALGAWALGDQLAAPALATAAKETALARFEELGESLSSAPLAKVQALLADERLEAKSEEAVFSAAKRWAEAQQPAPAEGELLGLMRHVRFACMRHEFVLNTVKPWPQLDTKAGKDMLIEATLGVAPVPRPGFGARALYALGGFGDGVLSSVEVYDVHSNTWAACAAMGSERCGAAAAVLGGKLYVLAGFDSEGAYLSTVEAFDPQSGTWSAVAPMSTERSGAIAVALGGRLYAIGGCSRFTRLSSVEAFDPQTGVWEAVAPTLTPKGGVAGAAVLGGKIYVVGGCGDEGNEVEVYDPATNSWAAVAPMPTARLYPGVAALGGKIYAAGGKVEDTLSTVEAYDPESNTWSAIAPMSTPRQSFGLATVRGKLYAVGGYGSDVILATAEAYDPQTRLVV